MYPYQSLWMQTISSFIGAVCWQLIYILSNNYWQVSVEGIHSLIFSNITFSVKSDLDLRRKQSGELLISKSVAVILFKKFTSYSILVLNFKFYFFRLYSHQKSSYVNLYVHYSQFIKARAFLRSCFTPFGNACFVMVADN